MTKQVDGYVWTSLPTDVKGNAERWTPSRMCRNVDDSIVQNVQDHDAGFLFFFPSFNPRHIPAPGKKSWQLFTPYVRVSLNSFLPLILFARLSCHSRFHAFHLHLAYRSHLHSRQTRPDHARVRKIFQPLELNPRRKRSSYLFFSLWRINSRSDRAVPRFSRDPWSSRWRTDGLAVDRCNLRFPFSKLIK